MSEIGKDHTFGLKILWRSYGMRFAMCYVYKGEYWFRIIDTSFPIDSMVRYSKPLEPQPESNEEAVSMARVKYMQVFDCDDTELDAQIEYYENLSKGGL